MAVMSVLVVAVPKVVEVVVIIAIVVAVVITEIVATVANIVVVVVTLEDIVMAVISFTYAGNTLACIASNDRVISEKLIGKDAEGGGRDQCEILSRFLLGESEENHKEPYSTWCLCRNSDQSRPEYTYTALPLGNPVRYNSVSYCICLHQVSCISKILRTVLGYGNYFRKLRSCSVTLTNKNGGVVTQTNMFNLSNRNMFRPG
jgi:hypothetical protein